MCVSVWPLLWCWPFFFFFNCTASYFWWTLDSFRCSLKKKKKRIWLLLCIEWCRCSIFSFSPPKKITLPYLCGISKDLWDNPWDNAWAFCRVHRLGFCPVLFVLPCALPLEMIHVAQSVSWRLPIRWSLKIISPFTRPPTPKMGHVMLIATRQISRTFPSF